MSSGYAIMILSPQVKKDHYRFDSYMSKSRWLSIWHQMDEIQRLKPGSVLEVGPGSGLLKKVAQLFGIHIETLDHDPQLSPDYVASVSALPFREASFDVVCAFQVLEHLPYEVALPAFAEMARVTRRHLVISLPDARLTWRYVIHVPGIPTFEFLIPKPQLSMPPNNFNGEHYWEINKHGYPLKRVISDLAAIIPLIDTYRVPENPYHRFLLFDRQGVLRLSNR